MMGDVSGPAVGKRKRDYGPCPKRHKVVNIVFDGTDDIATADIGAKSYGDDWVALETAAQKEARERSALRACRVDGCAPPFSPTNHQCSVCAGEVHNLCVQRIFPDAEDLYPFFFCSSACRDMHGTNMNEGGEAGGDDQQRGSKIRAG